MVHINKSPSTGVQSQAELVWNLPLQVTSGITKNFIKLKWRRKYIGRYHAIKVRLTTWDNLTTLLKERGHGMEEFTRIINC